MDAAPPVAGAKFALPLTLALIAGYIDAYGLLSFNTFLSFMSGNTTQTGAMLGIERWNAALPSAVAIVFFVAGCFVGAYQRHSAWRFAQAVLLLTVAALLGFVILLVTLTGWPPEFAIAVASLAMGVMNAATTHLGPQTVSLTFVTGTLNQVGSHLALATRGVPLADAESPRDSHLRRALLLTTLWACFAAGAVLGGIATTRLGVWMLPPAIGLLAVLAGGLLLRRRGQ